MEKDYKLTNGRYLSVSTNIYNKKGIVNFQVMDIKEERGFISREFVLFQCPSHRYLVDMVPRKTSKAVQAFNEKALASLHETVPAFLKKHGPELEINETN